MNIFYYALENTVKRIKNVFFIDCINTKNLYLNKKYNYVSRLMVKTPTTPTIKQLTVNRHLNFKLIFNEVNSIMVSAIVKRSKLRLLSEINLKSVKRLEWRMDGHINMQTLRKRTHGSSKVSLLRICIVLLLATNQSDLIFHTTPERTFFANYKANRSFFRFKSILFAANFRLFSSYSYDKAGYGKLGRKPFSLALVLVAKIAACRLNIREQDGHKDRLTYID